MMITCEVRRRISVAQREQNKGNKQNVNKYARREMMIKINSTKKFSSGGGSTNGVVNTWWTPSSV